MDSTQNIISFCTGYGGLEIGIKRAGVDVRTVCYNEIEAFAQANLVAKIEEGRLPSAPIWTDLKTFPASIFRGKVHGLIGGYPCQPFSSAGKRKGEDDPRHLWPYIRKHIRAIRPVWCFFENVRGHTTMGLWRVLSDLEEDGYQTEFGLFSAEETGAPHQRIRVFILAKLPNANLTGLEGEASERVQGREGRGKQYEVCESPRVGRQNSEEVLGNPEHNGSLATQDGRSTCEEQEEGRMQKLEGGCEQSEELGNSTRKGSSECRTKGEVGSESEATSGERREPSPPFEHAMSAHHGGGSEEQLADCDNQRCDREQISVQPGRSQQKGDEIMRSSRATRWPAHPGEEQHEWEEPRVVADSKVKRCGGRKDKDGEDGEGLSEQEGKERSILRSKTEGCSGDGETTNDEAQSQLGGAVDGPRSGVDAIANRVDRLRLLGNGVVPQTAEIAWKTLWGKINGQD